MEVREHAQLSDYNTMGVEAKARYFAEVHSIEDVLILLNDDRFEDLPKMVIGGGSNILFKNDYEGLLILNSIKGREIIIQNNEHILLELGAGENWHEVVEFCVEQGWGGIENLSLIPGSVGAAPIQNIGAYGVELEEVFVSLDAIMLDSGEFRSFSKKECRFGYRDSIFKQELKGEVLITSVILKLQMEPRVNTSYRALEEKLKDAGIEHPSIRDIHEAVMEIRQSKLPNPAEIGNTGSFFKNPVIHKEQFEKLKFQYPDMPSYPAAEGIKIPAAWLIDQCGWKGKRVGDAGVHKMQALVLVNYGNATGKEIWELARQIQASVEERFGVSLIPEVNLV